MGSYWPAPVARITAPWVSLRSYMLGPTKSSVTKLPLYPEWATTRAWVRTWILS